METICIHCSIDNCLVSVRLQQINQMVGLGSIFRYSSVSSLSHNLGPDNKELASEGGTLCKLAESGLSIASYIDRGISILERIDEAPP